MRLVAYCWLSTNGQGDSRADLDAQRAAAEGFARLNDGEIVSEHIEVQWGRRCDWPKLAEAIAEAQRVEGTLVIAKLDRLARNAVFTAILKEAGIDFVCCDNPNANRLTIHILAGLADQDTKRISARTKAALSAAKARGVKLGSAREGHWEGREEQRREGARKGLRKAVKAAAEARSEKAREAYSAILPAILEMRNKEHLTLAEIAQRLNAEGHQTRAGRPFSPSMIIRLIQRADANQPQPPAALPEPPAAFPDLPLFRLCRDPAGAGEK